jgi:hypothetical protein
MIASQPCADLTANVTALCISQESERATPVAASMLQLLFFVFNASLSARWQCLLEGDGLLIAVEQRSQKNTVTNMGAANALKIW